jgi:hypothetical protein
VSVSRSAGLRSTCAIKADQSVVCWGLEDLGEATPPPGKFIAVAAARYHHSCGILADQKVVCWGDNLNGELEVPGGEFEQVAVGWGWSCGVHVGGVIECWGPNLPTLAPLGGTFVEVGVGDSFICGRRTDGTIACTGHGSGGETLHARSLVGPRDGTGSDRVIGGQA